LGNTTIKKAQRNKNCTNYRKYSLFRQQKSTKDLSFEYYERYDRDRTIVIRRRRKLKFFNAILIIILSIILLSACGKSNFKVESKETIEVVKETLNEKAKKTNNKSGDINFYLPFGYEIEEESPNNILLKNGSKQYILFNNPQESKESDVVYKSTVTQNNDIEINEQFKNSNQFGYLIIKKLEEDMNEMTIGIGGTKITTLIKTSSLKNEAAVMTQIVKSVKNQK
jgi:hypothetical protein